jgi:Zn-dependent membrane protease YugP
MSMEGAEVRGLMDSLDGILPWITALAVGAALIAQLVVQLMFARASRWPARTSGYAVARQLLHAEGLYELEIEPAAGATLTYFDKRRRCLQLSTDIYHGRHIAAAGFAAREAVHAMDAVGGNGWSRVRELAVTAATFGSGAGIVLAAVGVLVRFPLFLALGVLLFAGVVLFELVVLPCEFRVSKRALRKVAALGTVTDDELRHLRWVLAAVTLTNVAETLQSVPVLWKRLMGLVQPREPDV